jgi:hypothetical protein
MTVWRDVRPRMKRLQRAGFNVYETHAQRHTAFNLSEFLAGGDA